MMAWEGEAMPAAVAMQHSSDEYSSAEHSLTPCSLVVRQVEGDGGGVGATDVVVVSIATTTSSLGTSAACVSRLASSNSSATS